MELRLLSTETERRIFAARTEQIRAKHGAGFKERGRSRLAKIHLTFGNLYALFENDGDPAEKMIAGLVMHDLEMFPQTCPRPDLSHLPPRSVSRSASCGREQSGPARWRGPVRRSWRACSMRARSSPTWA